MARLRSCMPGVVCAPAEARRRALAQRGPYVREASEVELLGALVRAYRDTADLIEARYKHPSVDAIDEDCPGCGYQHPALFRGEGGLVLRCPICGGR